MDKKLINNYKEAIVLLENVGKFLTEMEDNPDIMDSEFSNDSIQMDDTTSNPKGDEDLLNSLNQIFTPILIMQGFENDSIPDKIQEAFSEASVLMERNIIQFDNSTKMAQLISVCALLIAQNKNTDKYRIYKKASEIRKSTKLDIQKEHYNEAKVLAQKYLVKVSTTNNSSVARQAANDLLPETQH